MPFEVKAREAHGVRLIHASGSLTLGGGGTSLRDTLHVLVSKGERKFLVNLREVHHIDSFGIGELVRSYATVRRNAGEMKFAQASKKVRDMLEITHLDAMFELHPDEDSALRSFR
jgi:anti-sigma B factor antagonist